MFNHGETWGRFEADENLLNLCQWKVLYNIKIKESDYLHIVGNQIPLFFKMSISTAPNGSCLSYWKQQNRPHASFIYTRLIAFVGLFLLRVLTLRFSLAAEIFHSSIFQMPLHHGFFHLM